MSELYIGVMSGTSMDGIDIALCGIDDTKCSLISSAEYPFDNELEAEILSVINGSTTLEQIGTIDNKLGTMFADAINAFITKESIDATSIKAIGLHGQTLWHAPDAEFGFSMQLGDANVVSAKTNIQVVADFRRMDIANGGQGAPFAPAFHQEIFKHLDKKTAVLNIGGMANITILGEELKGWDTGCGNVLMDYWSSVYINKNYDKDALFALKGEVKEELLESFLKDEYFSKLPPKSTGREYFNPTWLANHLPLFDTIKAEDIQRTLLELTAKSIADDANKIYSQLLIVCGGGAKNPLLMQRLKELCKAEVKVSDEFGVSSDYMEAMAFAWLAYKRVHREVVELSSVTGASKDSILGGIYG
ncbi:anhydro-N-acetylmuramic acid kinase [Sulfurimonas gotlandica GD1]|uniref:Anhydro-N-acetylmuramic acid kinase n=1 Tax=Sulfurimonas gotlandica (strain DSM 19862 / JCM 16533 / GD1) TaxID=929558 RepID=B6BGC3_SULGG|nr:anhydro-N-acetylmuramic acid kinase [Sulfurimonas gotlandica]EDZ63809.1 anhydro-N-acetylmuramic acid kinase [Sulfurimonas gotlandica GD1]EHP29550.1 anhydro-N-acetylmuramic acid kinase [Sulfurimonas gotlandica GD1]